MLLFLKVDNTLMGMSSLGNEKQRFPCKRRFNAVEISKSIYLAFPMELNASVFHSFYLKRMCLGRPLERETVVIL